MKREKPDFAASSASYSVKRQDSDPPITTVKISKINGTEESHNNVAFFQQDQEAIVMSPDSGFGGAYTFGLSNTRLALILIKEREVMVIHTTSGDAGDMFNSLICDRLIIISGGGMMGGVMTDHHKEKINDLEQQICYANEGKIKVSTATAHSGAIYISSSGSVLELSDHVVSLMKDHGLKSNAKGLASHDYKFDRDGIFKLIDKAPPSAIFELRGAKQEVKSSGRSGGSSQGD